MFTIISSALHFATTRSGQALVFDVVAIFKKLFLKVNSDKLAKFGNVIMPKWVELG